MFIAKKLSLIYSRNQTHNFTQKRIENEFLFKFNFKIYIKFKYFNFKLSSDFKSGFKVYFLQYKTNKMLKLSPVKLSRISYLK